MDKIQDIENWLTLAFLNIAEIQDFNIALNKDVLLRIRSNKKLFLQYLYTKNTILFNSKQFLDEMSYRELNKHKIYEESETKSNTYFFSRYSTSLDELNVHPRMFMIDKNAKHDNANKDSNQDFTYHINRYYPELTSDRADCLSKMKHNNILASTTFKYCRMSKNFKKKRDVLCSFCFNKNWIDWGLYKYHLLFSHGILISSINYKPSITSLKKLFPLPYAIYENTEGSFINTFVMCGKCGIWVLLGKHSYDENEDLSKLFGFFWRYFYHYVNCHRTH